MKKHKSDFNWILISQIFSHFAQIRMTTKKVGNCKFVYQQRSIVAVEKVLINIIASYSINEVEKEQRISVVEFSVDSKHKKSRES